MSNPVPSLPPVPPPKVVHLSPATSGPSAGEARKLAPRPAAAKGSRLKAAVRQHALNVLPPLLAIAAIVGLWELLCAAPDASLPPPSRVISETRELIVSPFYDRGGIDKGLFWHIYASLKRVALGYFLASVAGIALGVLV